MWELWAFFHLRNVKFWNFSTSSNSTAAKAIICLFAEAFSQPATLNYSRRIFVNPFFALRADNCYQLGKPSRWNNILISGWPGLREIPCSLFTMFTTTSSQAILAFSRNSKFMIYIKSIRLFPPWTVRAPPADINNIYCASFFIKYLCHVSRFRLQRAQNAQKLIVICT